MSLSEKFILRNDDKYQLTGNLCLSTDENLSESFRYYYYYFFFFFHQILIIGQFTRIAKNAINKFWLFSLTVVKVTKFNYLGTKIFC